MANPNLPKLVTQAPKEENPFILKFEAWKAHKFAQEPTSSYQHDFQPFGDFLKTLSEEIETWGVPKLFKYLELLGYILKDNELAEFHEKIIQTQKNTILRIIDKIKTEIPTKETGFIQKISGLLSAGPEKSSLKKQDLNNIIDDINTIINLMMTKLNSREDELKTQKETAQTIEEKNNIIKDRQLYREYRVQLTQLKNNFK